MKTVAVVLTRSTTLRICTSSAIEPPSLVVTWQRVKPVAIFCSSVAPGRRSPASCSIVKRS
jgi:hypothetical protein